MKYLFLLSLPVLWLCGCGAHDDSKVIALEKRVVLAEARSDAEKEAQEKLAAELKTLKEDIAKRPAIPPVDTQSGLSRDEVKREITAAIDALRKELAQAKAAEPKPEEPKAAGGTTSKPAEPKEKSEADKAKAVEEAKSKLAEKLPRFYENVSDPILAKEVYELLWHADAKTRKEVVDRLKQMVAENPEDKHLRLALANALITQFLDVKQPMEQGMLAGAIMKEVKKAEQIDPEFYDAVAFLAIYKANYPEGFVEFNEAYKDLDRALAMQAKMAWEDRFGEIYVAYAQWYFKQKKYDEALTKVQEGLDKDARNQELIDLKKKIEDAKK